MLDTNALKAENIRKGKTQAYIVREIGISVKDLNSKINNHSALKTTEIERIIDILGIENPMPIFLLIQ